MSVMSSTAPTVVSVDWDFFCAHPPAGTHVTAPDGSQVSARTVGPLICPWETKGDYVRDVEWQTKIHLARNAGVDIAEHYRVGRHDPAAVAAALAARFDLAGCHMHVTDSHRHALEHTRAFAAGHGPVNVLNFDAHHDLGYDLVQVDYEADGGEVQCDSWLLWALARGYARNALVIHPDWMEDQHDDTYWPASSGMLLDLPDDCAWDVVPYGQWDAPDAAPVRGPVLLSVARSSWWSPPWCDEQFVDFVATLRAHGANMVSAEERALTPRPHEPTAP